MKDYRYVGFHRRPGELMVNEMTMEIERAPWTCRWAEPRLLSHTALWLDVWQSRRYCLRRPEGEVVTRDDCVDRPRWEDVTASPSLTEQEPTARRDK